MPVLIDVPFDYNTLSLSPEKDSIRSAGLHLTDITKHRLLSYGINRAGKANYDSPQKKMIFEQGFLWERIIAYILNQYQVDLSGGELVRPGEDEIDGIFLTPDAINIIHWRLEEWKSTYIREKNMIKLFADGSSVVDIETHKPEWLWQAMAYCKLYGMTEAFFRIWFWGDMPAKVRQVLVQFTPAEVEKNWSMIIQHRKYMQKLGVIRGVTLY
jgi:hypothetical protein